MMKLSDELGKEEQLYKSLYQQCCGLWEKPVTDWTELVHRYHKAGIRKIPSEPPSKMGNRADGIGLFTENGKRWYASIIFVIVLRFFISWSLLKLFIFSEEV